MRKGIDMKKTLIILAVMLVAVPCTAEDSLFNSPIWTPTTQVSGPSATEIIDQWDERRERDLYIEEMERDKWNDDNCREKEETGMECIQRVQEMLSPGYDPVERDLWK